MGQGQEFLLGRAFRLRLLLWALGSAVLVLAYRPRLFVWWWPVDYLFTALVIAWLSAFQWAALCLLMEKAGR